MLQRIQTIYMLANVVAVLMMFFFPLASFQIPEATFEMTALGVSSLTEEVAYDQMGWSILVTLLVMLFLPLVCIFLYKKRTLQLRILIYTAILSVLYYGLYFFECHNAEQVVQTFTQGEVLTTYSYIMLVMPALAIFCAIMAMRGVIYDIALLKSLDRLR